MAKEYIERNELIENLQKFAPEHYNALINQLITKQPIADVVEVVRCKDCTHSKEYPMRIICHRFGRDVNENGFCSYGRKEIKERF